MRIYTQTKGLDGAKEACRASPEAFAWPALYLGSRRATAHRDELARLAENLLSEPTVRNLWRQQLSLTRIFDWLEEFPADTWQDRRLLSGCDDLGSGWGPQGPRVPKLPNCSRRSPRWTTTRRASRVLFGVSDDPYLRIDPAY
ncbi:hypothetical protein ACWC0A_23245 [Streptomyces scopuliridis]